MFQRNWSSLVSVIIVVSLSLAACSPAQPKPESTATFIRPTSVGPTPTPRPLGSPVLVDHVPVNGEELLLDHPIVLTFDQPMDRDSVQKAITVSDDQGASVPGRVEWASDNVARFVPEAEWQRAARYKIDLNPDAKSSAGLRLARPESFSVGTIGNLAVAQTIPADGTADVAADTLITVLFNRPVVSLTTLAKQADLPTPLTFDPPITGVGEWLNTSIYVFRPAQPLAGGTQYRGNVAAGLRDTTGALLAGDYAWSFSVAAPVVRFAMPPEGALDIDITQPISLTFSQKMDHAATEAAFTIAPPVKGRFVWADEAPSKKQAVPPYSKEGAEQPLVGAAPRPTVLGEVMAFVPDEPMARGAIYTVRISNSAKAASSDATLQADYVLRFNTVERLAIKNTEPANGEGRAATNGGFKIKFTAPVQSETIVPNLRFQPPISLTNVYSYYSDYDKTFNINANFQPSTVYTVTIGADIADNHATQIGKDTIVQFTTGPLPPFAMLRTTAQVGTYNGYFPTSLFASYRNVTQLNFQLSSLTPQDFWQLTGASESYERFNQYKPAKDKILREWSAPTVTKLNEGGLYRAQLDVNGGALLPGIYLLSLGSPEVAALDPNYQPQRHILIVSKLHVAFKRGDRTGLVWATDMASGQPVGELPVSFRNKNFDEIATSKTNSASADDLGQALADFPANFRVYDQSYAVVGTPGNANFAVVYSEMADGINTYDFQLPSRYNSDPYYAYIYTDRPIYRPGQMVFFKGIVRADNDARYSIASNLNATNVSVNSPQGQVVFSQSLQINANGTFSGQLALDNNAPSGSYYLQACLPLPPEAMPVSKPNDNSPQCSYYGVPFLVSAYRAPEYEVSLTLDKVDYKQGDVLSATLDAKYFAGGNVADAKVQWTLTARDFIFDRYTGPGGYSFGDYDYNFGTYYGPGYNESIATGAGQTDSNGKLTISLPADISKRRTSAVFGLEVSVTDANDQSVSARAEATVHKGAFYMGIAPENYVGTVGAEFKANVISVDWQGQPLANQTGTVGFYRREWFTSQEEDAYGNREFTSVPSDTLTSEQPVTTDADGKTSVSFTPATGGEYRLKASGDSGAAVAATSIYVSSDSEYVAWRINNNDRLDLKSDKSMYQVGETAKILVPSPYVGPVQALLTVERGGFLTRKTLTLNSNSEILDIPIDASYAPNAFVSVLLVKGVDDKNPLPSFKLGYAQFSVDPSNFALKVEITPDKPQYAPRDTATYAIQVTDSTGNPVQAEVSLSLVDKAVLSLADDNSGPLLDSFYGLRGISVRTADTLSVNVDRLTRKIATDAGKGGGGGGGEASGSPFVRRNFKDTAYWAATINTDAQGSAKVSVILPDNLTTWVMDARAVTLDTKVGQRKNEVLSTKALLIRPITPRFFVVGDSVTLGAVVNNNTDKDIEAEVKLDAQGLTLNTIPVQKILAKANKVTRADWNVVVQDAAGAALTFSVNGGGLQDSVQTGLASANGAPMIPILRYAAPETIGTAGDIGEPGKRTEIIALPPRLDTGMGQLDIQIDGSLAAASARAIKALDDYPYASTDWVAARLLANLASVRFMQKTGLGDPVGGQANLNDLVTRGVQRLFTEQKSDGGWGWWSADNSDELITAIVLQALAQAQQANFAVDEASMSRAREFITSKLTPASDLPSASAANRQAYLLFALVESGTRDSGRLGALYENREKLSHYGRALLALALNQVQANDERIKTLLADIQSAAITSATGVSWEEAARDTENFYGRTRSTSIILEALVQLDPKNGLIPNIVRWLMAARERGDWSSVQENTWAITALADWIVASGELAANYDWRVTLNDNSVLTGKAEASNLAEPTRLTVEMARLLTQQANELIFERGAGAGHLYYAARLTAYLPVEEIKAANRGILVARKYESADCLPKPGTPCPAIDSAKIGENVRVRLTIVAPTALHYLTVNDPFPGGAEAVDTSLKTAQQTADLSVAGADNNIFGFGDAYGWGWWWFSHTELRDDHAALFATYLPAGTYEYTYVLRPSIVGQFKVLPTHAAETYFPEVFGRSDGGVFTIVK